MAANPSVAYAIAQQNYAANPGQSTLTALNAAKTSATGIGTPIATNYIAPSTANNAAVATSVADPTVSANNQYLTDQQSQLQDLLNRTNTGLDQGLQTNASQYQQQLDQANAAKAQQYDTYATDRTTQNQNKQGAYDTINQNANQGYSSLAQLIGRASGTGSSAFQELLPQVVGKDTSQKRSAASTTYGQNLAAIDKNQNNYDLSFQNTLNDLSNQKKSNEDTLRTGIETQRQSINSQLAQNAATIAQNKGGGAAAVKAAEAPYQQNITNSRNAVDSFFAQFQPNYSVAQAVADPVNLSDYTTDRSAINIANQGGDASNPYASLLQKKLNQQT